MKFIISLVKIGILIFQTKVKWIKKLDELEETTITSILSKRSDKKENKKDKKIKKIKFINKNRPGKMKSQSVSKSDIQYISLESKLVSHICPILNTYAIKAYLSKEVAKKVEKLPNVISCEKAHKIERPSLKKSKKDESKKNNKSKKIKKSF